MGWGEGSFPIAWAGWDSCLSLGLLSGSQVPAPGAQVTPPGSACAAPSPELCASTGTLLLVHLQPLALQPHFLGAVSPL